MNSQIFASFCELNYYRIVKEFLRVCAETGLERKELALVVDFMPDKDGIIPALKIPPEFTVGITKEYFEGSRPAEPDWFYKNVEGHCYEEGVAHWMHGVKDRYQHLSVHEILGLVRSVDSSAVTSPFNLMSSQGRKLLFSDEVFEVFGKFLSDGEVEKLTATGLWSPDEVDSYKKIWNMDQNKDDITETSVDDQPTYTSYSTILSLPIVVSGTED